MRIHHRMQVFLAAMGAWAAVQRKELVAKVGKLKADVLLGSGRYHRDHPNGSGHHKDFHTADKQLLVGSRAACRRSDLMVKQWRRCFGIKFARTKNT